MVWPVVVGKTPPAVQLAEGEIQPSLAAEVFQRHQLAGRGEQLSAVGKRFVQVAGGMQDIRSDDEIVAVCCEPLFHRVLFDVQHAVVQRCAALREACLRLGKEARRYVGVDVVKPVCRQLREHRSRCRTGASADLEHSEPALRRQPGHQSPNRVAQHPVGRPRHGCLQVEIGCRGLAGAEQEGQRILLAAEHLGQRIAASPKKPDLVRTVCIPSGHFRRMAVRVGVQPLRQRIPGAHEDSKAIVRLLQHLRAGQQLEHASEQPLVLVQDLQAAAEFHRVHDLPGDAFPADSVERQESIGTR